MSSDKPYAWRVKSPDEERDIMFLSGDDLAEPIIQFLCSHGGELSIITWEDKRICEDCGSDLLLIENYEDYTLYECRECCYSWEEPPGDLDHKKTIGDSNG